MSGEREFTDWLREFFPRDRRHVPVGIGDDGAVVRNRGAESVLVCDPVVEGVHFDADAPVKWVGRKAVNRNLSDLAAMGARPDYLLVSALLPSGTPARRRRGLFEGVRDAAAAAGCTVVGGDVAVTPGPLVLTISAVGHLKGRALRRGGARAGDRIHVTGPLGGASLGSHLRFRPALDEGVWLAAQPGVSAAIDVSDGLLLDLGTMLAASGRDLGAELEEARIPLSPAARRLAKRTKRSALDHALHDGEDHVLLFTVCGDAGLPARGPLTDRARQPIGVVTRESGLRLRTVAGTTRAVAAQGYEHAL